jgi:uncharacterized membrane protein SpoIIM required for sporulation
MVSIQWIEKRRPHWERLEKLTAGAGKNVSHLTHAQLQELGLLYRQAASDLSVVLQDSSSAQLAAYLNQLLARSHNLVYMGRGPKGSGLLGFYRDTYPRVFRECWPTIVLATMLFLVSGLVGWAVVLNDAGFAYRFLGPDMMDTIQRREMWTRGIVAIKPLASSAITTNNLSVAFMAFASGITVVIPIWMMVLNGLMLGIVGAATWKAGMALSLWTFVVAHGSLELPAICIAGGAGLEIARGLVFPGLLPRKASLAAAGGRASKLVLGTIPMLLIAGLIEGFLSPSEMPAVMKFTLGGILFSGLVIYLFGTARHATKGSGL